MTEVVSEAPRTLHASAVEAGGRGLLILGPPGSGKSTLALDLIALGARLVADDAVTVRRVGGALFLSAPFGAGGRVEARGVGVLSLTAESVAIGETPLTLAIDLGAVEDARLPPRRLRMLDGVSAPLLHRPRRLHPAAILVALRCGGPDDPDAAIPPLRGAPDRAQCLRPGDRAGSGRMDG